MFITVICFLQSIIINFCFVLSKIYIGKYFRSVILKVLVYLFLNLHFLKTSVTTNKHSDFRPDLPTPITRSDDYKVIKNIKNIKNTFQDQNSKT